MCARGVGIDPIERSPSLVLATGTICRLQFGVWPRRFRAQLLLPRSARTPWIRAEAHRQLVGRQYLGTANDLALLPFPFGVSPVSALIGFVWPGLVLRVELLRARTLVFIPEFSQKLAVTHGGTNALARCRAREPANPFSRLRPEELRSSWGSESNALRVHSKAVLNRLYPTALIRLIPIDYLLCVR